MTDWTPNSAHLRVDHIDGVAVIVIDRPDKLNALTAEMRRDLAAAIRFHGDGERARGVVVTGAGRAFCAGEDLATAADEAAGDGIDAAIELFHDITRAVLTTRVPCVAAVNGIAVGGAAELTLCFDARLGAPEAAYLLPENGLGLVVSNAASLLLPRLLGGAGLRLVLDGTRVEADRALELGLLDALVADGDVVAAAVALVDRWTTDAPSTAAHLELLRPSLDEVEEAFRRETIVARRVWESGAADAGLARFRTSREGDDRPAATAR